MSTNPLIINDIPYFDLWVLVLHKVEGTTSLWNSDRGVMESGLQEVLRREHLESGAEI